MQEENKSQENINIPVPGHYVDAFLATKESLLKSDSTHARVMAKDFKGIELSAIEHRLVMAIFGIYDETGYNPETFKKGISLTSYELCKRMGYRQDRKGRFGGKTIKEALEALINLTKKTFTIYYIRFKRKKRKKNIFDVIAFPNWPLLRIIYEASDVDENGLLTGQVEERVSKIHIKIEPLFFNISYFRLFQNNFYLQLKALLEKQSRRVSKYHWNFAIWCLKHKGRKKPIEINVDKLAIRLKIPCDPAHMTRARQKLRKLYSDFKRLEYLADYRIDIPAQNGKTKDIIILRG